jgi:hypothetical protein
MKQNERITISGTKNKGGRPKAPIKKNKVISVKCTAMDKMTIKGKARAAQTTVSELLLKLGLEGKIDRSKSTLPADANKLISIVNNIANNINQIAKKLHQTGQVTPYWKEQLEFHLGELKKIELTINSYFI